MQTQESRWQLLVTAPRTCAVDCQQLVYLARQIQVGLGRDASRATHALAMAQPLADDYAALLQREIPATSALPLDLPVIHRARKAMAPRNCGSSTLTAI